MARIKRRRFDLAILMPNSLRSALLVSTAGIPRRVGYDRDGRGLLLTDRLLPMRRKGRYVPVPAVDYYLGLARYVGTLAEKRLPPELDGMVIGPKDEIRLTFRLLVDE